MSRRHPTPNWTEVRLRLWDRARGRCEGCGRYLGDDGAVHHRKLRSQGGDHQDVNLLLLHTTCHTWAHANRRRSEAHGWIVGMAGDPAAVPVIQCRTPATCLEGSHTD